MYVFGSRSIAKVISVTDAFSQYPELWQEDEQIEYMMIPKEVRNDTKTGTSIDNFSGISCIPNGIEEIIQGAKNRALNAFEHAKKVKRHLSVWSGIRIRDVSS